MASIESTQPTPEIQSDRDSDKSYSDENQAPRTSGQKRSRREYERHSSYFDGLDDGKLMVYIKKLRSLQLQKEYLAEKIMDRHQAQMRRLQEQHQLILRNLLCPSNTAIHHTMDQIQAEMDKIEEVNGTSHGRYCRECFQFEGDILHCNECTIPICEKCSIHCDVGSSHLITFCQNCCNLQ